MTDITARFFYCLFHIFLQSETICGSFFEAAMHMYW